MKIGLISDTHGHLDYTIIKHLHPVDEIWHAGDFGTMQVCEKLAELSLVRGVFGNIDPPEVQGAFPEELVFEAEELRVAMIHIGGYPGNYSSKAQQLIKKHQPGLLISGHSHILKVMPDEKNNLLHINPGAAGLAGLHGTRTLVTFEVRGAQVHDLKVVELGLRATLPKPKNILSVRVTQ